MRSPFDLALALGVRAILDAIPLVEHPLDAGDGLGGWDGHVDGELERCLLGARRRTSLWTRPQR